MSHADENDRRLNEIVKKNYQRIFRIANKRIGNVENAGDITQDTFVMFTRQYYEQEYYDCMTDEQMGYLLSCIVWRRASNFLRNEIRRNEHLNQFDEQTTNPSAEAQAFSEINVEIIRTSMRELPEEYATYFYLTNDLGMNPEAVANELGVKQDSLRAIASRARKMLKKICESKGVEVRMREKRGKKE